MMRILITGASGYIGRHCLAALRGCAAEIHATASRDCSHLSDPQVHWHRCDLLQHAQTQRLIRDVRPTHLLHLAWIATPGIFWTSELNEAWRAASRELGECFCAAGGARMVVAGTCAEYDFRDGVCHEERRDPDPVTPYARAKLALYDELSQRAARSGVGLAWPRLFWSYGPYEHPSRLVPSIICSLLRDEPALCTAGAQRRDYLHVTDLASALADIVCGSITGPINVGSGNAVSVAFIASTIATEMKKAHLLRLGAIATAVEEPPLVVADTTRLRNELGFKAKVTLAAGLRDTIRWWKNPQASDTFQTAGYVPSDDGVCTA